MFSFFRKSLPRRPLSGGSRGYAPVLRQVEIVKSVLRRNRHQQNIQSNQQRSTQRATIRISVVDMKPVRSSYQDFRPSYIVPKRSFYRKHPLAIQIVTTSTFLLTFFSRPIYDIFFRDYVDVPQLPSQPSQSDSK